MKPYDIINFFSVDLPQCRRSN